VHPPPKEGKDSMTAAIHPANIGDGQVVKLVAIVVTHNRLGQLKKTLAALLATPQQHLDAVVVFNNASTDGTESWLQTLQDPRVLTETAAENIGGAGGFEAAMRLAVKLYSPDWVVLMDDDGRPEPGALCAFQAHADGKFDAIAAAVFMPDGQICDINRPSVNPFWRKRRFFPTLRHGREGFHLDLSDYAAAPQTVDAASFVGLFLSRNAIRRAGYPDGRMFIYGDDTLYTLRLTKLGGKLGFCPDIRFTHDFTSKSKDTKQFHPLWKTYYHHRNSLKVYAFAAGRWYFLVVAVLFPRWITMALVHKGDRIIFLKLLFRGVFDRHRAKSITCHKNILALARPQQDKSAKFH